MNAETLIDRTPNLQVPSPTVVRLLNLLNNPDADYDEVIATVNRDAVLSAKLLAICNSTSYGLAQPMASVGQGVLYLGFGEIHRLVMELSFGSQIGSGLSGYDMEAGVLWHHSLVTALLTPRVLGISKKFATDTSIAYTAGLVHDIGTTFKITLAGIVLVPVDRGDKPFRTNVAITAPRDEPFGWTPESV